MKYPIFLLHSLIFQNPHIKRKCLHATSEGSTAVVEYAEEMYVINVRPVESTKKVVPITVDRVIMEGGFEG